MQKKIPSRALLKENHIKEILTMPDFSVSDTVYKTAAEEFGTPFHLYDEKGLRETARAMKKAFAWNEGFKEYFAVKALPTPGILSILKDEGIGLDCSSMTELMLAKAVGVLGKEIMFSANEMPPEEFVYAHELGAYINLDDITHIGIFKEYGIVPETVCMRFNPGGDFLIGTHVMGNPGDAKYGMTREQLVLAAKELKALGVKAFGLHAFLSSNTQNADYYPTLAKLLFEIAKEVSVESGLHLDFVNLSGGIGIPYRPEDTPIDIAAIGSAVKAAYEAVGLAGVKVFTELGRYMTGPHGRLVTRAVHEKNIYKNYIGVDASACDLMRPAMYGAYHHIHIVDKRDIEASHIYDIVGALCENNDKFAIDRKLPEIKLGDLLVIHDTGAHGRAMGYNYNGRMRCQEVLLKEDDSLERIRRGETPKDYFATLDGCEIYKTLEKDPHFKG